MKCLDMTFFKYKLQTSMSVVRNMLLLKTVMSALPLMQSSVSAILLNSPANAGYSSK